MTGLVLVVFAAVYLGMALGRWPGLKVDRTGIALLGAILLYGSGAVDGAAVLAAIDFPTLVILFGLMILSAQFAACGFYDWCSARIATAAACRPRRCSALTVVAAGLLSAVLANDVVVFAMTPMLCTGLVRRGLDPRPFVIALAGGANAGSAATIIGNPQNILIGEVGGLDFWRVPRRLRAAGARRPRLRLPGGLVAVAHALSSGRTGRAELGAARARPARARQGGRRHACCSWCCSRRRCRTSKACCWSRATC